MDREGNLVTAVQQRSEPATDMPLTWPPGAGVRVRSVTERLDEELAGRIIAFLRGLNWLGFVGLMFIVGKDGEPRLVDFNGRIPMSFHQSIAACPQLPDLWARVITGRELLDPPPVRVGVRYQWFWGDVRRALSERRGGLVADLLGCLAYARGSAHGIWNSHDPWPAIRYWQRHLRNVPRVLRRHLAEKPP
jgi:hypothetical protein